VNTETRRAVASESPPLRIGIIGNGVVASPFVSAFEGSEEVDVTAMTCNAETPSEEKR